MEKDTTKALSKVIRIDTRAGHYKRKLHTKAGEVAVKVPKLRKQTFETAIIERYRRRDISIEEAIVFGNSVRLIGHNHNPVAGCV